MLIIRVPAHEVEPGDIAALGKLVMMCVAATQVCANGWKITRLSWLSGSHVVTRDNDETAHFTVRRIT